MNGILMSIRPKFSQQIFIGRKRFEYRRKFPLMLKGSKVFVYETAPTKKVVGEFEIKNIISGPVQAVWEFTCLSGGNISYSEYLEYFDGCDLARAIEIHDTTYYGVPFELSDFGLERPPQSYQYVDIDFDRPVLVAP